MADLDPTKVKTIISLIGKKPESEIRKEVRKVFGVKKTRGNEIYKIIFNRKNTKKYSPFFKINGDKGSVDIKVSKDVKDLKTLDDLVKYCNIDTSIWTAKKFTSNVWDNKLQLKAEFEKRKDAGLIAAKEEILEEIRKFAPVASKIHKKDSSAKDLMLEIALVDTHLGRLCWSPSDGDDYDLKIAQKLVNDAIDDIIVKSLKYDDYSKVLLWIGGDYLNVDNENNSTTADTQQSVDSRFPKVFREGKNLLINIIEKLKKIAPVEVLITRGNHDYNSMFHMGEVIDAYFSRDENVKVNNEPAPRKYITFGSNLIQFSHGDKVDLKKLPSLACTESPFWSQSKYREVHTAHLHHEKMMIDEISGCKIRVMNTLAGVDHYHSTHGYVKNLRSVPCFVWHKNFGLQSILYSNPVN